MLNFLIIIINIILAAAYYELTPTTYIVHYPEPTTESD